MDIASLSSGLALSGVGQQVDVGVLKALQNLSKATAAELFSSIGLGSQVDSYA